jgi:MFS family permease
MSSGHALGDGRHVTAGRRAVLAASAGGFVGLYLELSVIPYIAGHESGNFAAGLITFALTVTTVAAQAVTLPLAERISPRVVLILGLLLIGPPTLLYALSQSLPVLLAVTLIRGAGFGFITIIGSGLTAAYSSTESRGASLGTYGVVVSVGAACAPAIGLAAYRHWSADAVFAMGAIPPALSALALARKLPPASLARRREDGRALARAALGPIVVLFLPIAAAVGVAFTYVPLLPSGSGPLLLGAFGAGFAAGRMVGGSGLDRGWSPSGFVVVLLAASIGGLLLLSTTAVVAVAIGALVSGLGIGALSTATLVIMLDRAGPEGLGTASLVWNAAYDVGMGVGALVLGAVASAAGPRQVFLVSAVVIAVVAGPAARFDWRRARIPSPEPL